MKMDMIITTLLVITALCNLGLAVLLFRKTHHHQAGRYFAWHILALAGWLLCFAGLELNYTPAVNLWFGRMGFSCGTMLVMSLLWFCAHFPYTDARFLRIARWLVFLGLPWLFLCWTPLFITHAHFRNGIIDSDVGPLIWVFGVWVFISAVASLLHMAMKQRTCRGLERLQIRYMLLGLIITAVIVITTNLIIPSITGSTRYILVGPIASLAITSTTTYAILRYRLMDIRFVLTAGLAYSCILIALSILFAFSVPYIEGFFTEHFSLPYHSAGFTVALLIGLAFFPLLRVTQSAIERLFRHTLVDYRQTLRDVSNALASAHESETLVRMMVSAVTNMLHPRFIAVYLLDNEGRQVRVAAIGANSELPDMLTDADPLLTYATRHDQVMLTEEFIREPEPHESLGRRLQSWGVNAAVPLSGGGRMSGIVLLGEKWSGDMYTAEDAGFLAIIGKQSALAFDNARHYDALRTLNAELEDRVTERTHQLATANMQLAAVNTALNAERAYLSAVIDILPVPLLLISPAEGHVPIRVNRKLLELIPNSSVWAIPQMPFLDPTTHLPIPRENWPYQRALRGEVATMCEAIALLPGGSEVPVIINAAPIYIDGELKAVAVAFQDITALKAADRAKDEFLAALSHELLNPLSSIIGWSETMLDAPPEPPILSKALKTIDESAHRLQHIVRDMLDFSRIIHQKMFLVTEEADLWELAEQSLEALQQKVQSRQMQVDLQPPQGDLPVYVDRIRIIQAISNLIDNAVKFADPGGTIRIAGRCDGKTAVLSVSDTGRGIPPDALAEVFIRFRQVERVEPSGGLGLGLALVKGIVELHGGQVSAYSAGRGQGSTFTIMLPLSTREYETLSARHISNVS